MSIAATASCGGGDAPADASVPGTRVDSVLSIAEHLQRFRDAVGARVDTLRSAAPSIDELVRRWAVAMAASDTLTLSNLALDRAEFAWLIYPEMKLSKPPYEMPPGLLWSQVVGNGDEGVRKALGRLAGHRVAVIRLECASEPEREGPNTVRQGCVVALRVDGQATPAERYFGSIVERDGRFKLMSHANRL